jgi:hypothetical protein
MHIGESKSDESMAATLKLNSTMISSKGDISLVEAFIHAVFNLTYDCEHPLRMPGPIIPNASADGGYVICNDPGLGWQNDNCTVFSFGINDDDTFESSLSRMYGCEVHEFDPTVKGSKGAATSEMVHFHPIGCWSHTANLSIGPVDSIENLVHRFHKRNSRLSLKIDVEGSEWEAFSAVPDALLDQFDHIIMEVHTWYPGQVSTPTQMIDYFVSSRMIDTLVRLREKFYLFHYNVINCCPPSQTGSLPYTPGPVELSFVRKALIPGVPSGPFHLHEEMNGLIDLRKSTLMDNDIFSRYGWDKNYERSWEAAVKARVH